MKPLASIRRVIHSSWIEACDGMATGKRIMILPIQADRAAGRRVRTGMHVSKHIEARTIPPEWRPCRVSATRAIQAGSRNRRAPRRIPARTGMVRSRHVADQPSRLTGFATHPEGGPGRAPRPCIGIRLFVRQQMLHADHRRFAKTPHTIPG